MEDIYWINGISIVTGAKENKPSNAIEVKAPPEGASGFDFVKKEWVVPIPKPKIPSISEQMDAIFEYLESQDQSVYPQSLKNIILQRKGS